MKRDVVWLLVLPSRQHKQRQSSWQLSKRHQFCELVIQVFFDVFQLCSAPRTCPDVSGLLRYQQHVLRVRFYLVAETLSFCSNHIY